MWSPTYTTRVKSPHLQIKHLTVSTNQQPVCLCAVGRSTVITLNSTKLPNLALAVIRTSTQSLLGVFWWRACEVVPETTAGSATHLAVVALTWVPLCLSSY